jgi:predicted acyl esterase
VVYAAAMGVSGVILPPDPIQQEPTYEAALAAFEAQEPVRILFDNGAGGAPGYPYPAFEHSFSTFPPDGTRGESFYFGEGGAMDTAKPTVGSADSFNWDSARPSTTNFSGNTGGGGNGLWTATPPYHWQQSPSGTAASYVTPPLTNSVVSMGAGAVEAWVKSSVEDPDLQVTISEVRPDGKEVFVQSGWLRATGRKLDKAKSTELEPVLSLRKKDDKPMPAGKYVKLTIPLYYQGHAYRAGSQIRVTISAPGGDQPIWAFDDATGQGANLSIAHSPEMPSRLLLPVTDGVAVPDGLPPCPGMRGEPCRDYVPYTNTSGPLKK